ncbi:MAG: type II secretion system protein [Dehalococcoidales bacterium]
MKHGEKGFTYIELIVSLAIIFLISGAATAGTFQVLKTTERNNAYVTVVRQVQNAGYWINHDAQMAQNVSADNLTSPDFVIMNWTEWDDAGTATYHSATYYFENLTDGTGTLKRNHWSSAGANEQSLIAENIYYDPNDVNVTSKASYQTPLLIVQLTALFEEAIETREYRIKHRPNL